jgi:hypothetical protein
MAAPPLMEPASAQKRDAGRKVSPHGKPPRGLMSTPSPQLFQGRFGRMFRSLRPARYGQTDQDSRNALMTLGAKMSSGFDEPKDGADAESGIPALYTYFGQFVDHDITFDPVSTLVRHKDPDGVTDFRTPALDLHNVYVHRRASPALPDPPRPDHALLQRGATAGRRRGVGDRAREPFRPGRCRRPDRPSGLVPDVSDRRPRRALQAEWVHLS